MYSAILRLVLIAGFSDIFFGVSSIRRSAVLHCSYLASFFCLCDLGSSG
ncbi:unknown protein [Desulfotalea psychrophila LSv54]|uniref:Uncharacterized protein n=1 Tax=Desulfotalea psychrophila (strain LSv54 / DSM 12343) TaxID=177439 RepID=Q6ASC5_DESPS|nr:unknown protein [Desulfotalea psychrophila LSv54]